MLLHARSINPLIQLVIMPSFTAQVLILMAAFLPFPLVELLPNTMAMLQCCLHQILNRLKRFGITSIYLQSGKITILGYDILCSIFFMLLPSKALELDFL